MQPKDEVDWIAVSENPLACEDIAAWVSRPHCGAVVTFLGTARSSSTTGHDIIELVYETSESLATTRMAEVVRVARERWPSVVAVALHHRVGSVALEQPAVVVAVSAPHRHEAFEAARYCIDAVKKSVPMWKREVWEGGSAWSQEAQTMVEARDA